MSTAPSRSTGAQLGGLGDEQEHSDGVQFGELSVGQYEEYGPKRPGGRRTAQQERWADLASDSAGDVPEEAARSGLEPLEELTAPPARRCKQRKQRKPRKRARRGEEDVPQAEAQVAPVEASGRGLPLGCRRPCGQPQETRPNTMPRGWS